LIARVRLIALAGAIVGATAAAPARAAEPLPRNELSFDVGAASFGMTHAWRTDSGVLIGGGGSVGLSPLLGRIVASGTHYDPHNHVNLLEVAQVQLFARFEPVSWLRIDTGLRAGVFIHGDEDYAGGPFAAVFVAPALAWRWLWIGPRVSGGWLSETNGGASAAALTFEYVMLRFVVSW
jgi:hypothetical protein